MCVPPRAHTICAIRTNNINAGKNRNLIRWMKEEKDVVQQASQDYCIKNRLLQIIWVYVNSGTQCSWLRARLGMAKYFEHQCFVFSNMEFIDSSVICLECKDKNHPGLIWECAKFEVTPKKQFSHNYIRVLWAKHLIVPSKHQESINATCAW